jgi:phosphoribosylaminoimidazole-succinocarboxamide synthase
MDIQTLQRTNFSFPNQTALYSGKVRDVYAIGDNLIVLVVTDRISAFDVILPRAIPYKGQVLNQLAASFLDSTADIVPNWLMAVPDPNVSIGLRAEPVKIELVIRGCLVGHAWREYSAGKRTISGVTMPEGMEEYDSFPEPIITPTTKAEFGHDEDLTEVEILTRRLATNDEWQQLQGYMRALFKRGQKMASDQGLVLADTKYEFGRLNGKLILIDEIHTPDSSRYFYADSYNAYVNGKKDGPDERERPRQLSKEFVREWLMEHGFSGQVGETLPEITDDFVTMVSERYIELYEKLTGKKFKKAPTKNASERVEASIKDYLEANSK